VKEFDLVKSKIEARDNGARDRSYKSGFREEADYMYLVTLLGRIIYFTSQGGNVYYEF
jgi:hypothetical protein